MYNPRLNDYSLTHITTFSCSRTDKYFDRGGKKGLNRGKDAGEMKGEHNYKPHSHICAWWSPDV